MRIMIILLILVTVKNSMAVTHSPDIQPLSKDEVQSLVLESKSEDECHALYSDENDEQFDQCEDQAY